MAKIKFRQSLINIFILVALASTGSSCKDKTNYYLVELDKLNKYIADNNITTQPKASGLYYIEILAGTGDRARSGGYVSVRYKGYFLDGTVFDQNLDTADPYTFPLGYGSVIAGWDEGISYMKEGGKAKLIIPSSLAYSSQEQPGINGGPVIPPYTTLIFEVELVNVQ
jgi:FKBP-type peptidyl-prolyl cis-trans isomerase